MRAASEAGSIAAIEAPVEWLQKVSSLVSLYLHPSYAENVECGVREVLNSQLIRYEERYGGVLLSYLKLKILNTSHKILPLFPYFSVKLRAEMLIFAPKAGMTIEGKVNRVLKDHIEMLVLGFFNAVVGASDMREDLFYDDLSGTWMSESDRRHHIMIGSRVSFLVKSVQEVEEFIDITGSLAPPNTGSLDWLSSQNQSIDQVDDRKEKKQKKRKVEEDGEVGKSAKQKVDKDLNRASIEAVDGGKSEGKLKRDKKKLEADADGGKSKRRKVDMEKNEANEDGKSEGKQKVKREELEEGVDAGKKQKLKKVEQEGVDARKSAGKQKVKKEELEEGVDAGKSAGKQKVKEEELEEGVDAEKSEGKQKVKRRKKQKPGEATEAEVNHKVEKPKPGEATTEAEVKQKFEKQKTGKGADMDKKQRRIA